MKKHPTHEIQEKLINLMLRYSASDSEYSTGVAGNNRHSDTSCQVADCLSEYKAKGHVHAQTACGYKHV